MLENEQGELQWIVLDEGESVQVYDLNDGQSYRPAFVNESSQYASTGYPEMLLPGGKVFVTHGSMDAPDFLDKIAYATRPRRLPFRQHRLYPGNDVHGQININRKGEYPMKKAIACLLVLPLTLAACGAQTTQPAPTTAPEMTTKRPPRTGKAPRRKSTSRASRAGCRHAVPRWKTAAGLYTLHELFNEAANEDVYCVVKTDIETATQEKVASITLDGGYYGMAVWDDAVDLYLQENTAEGERPSLRYTIDTATGGVEKQQMDGAFAPTWR